MTDVTRILSAIEEGDARVAEQLLPLVYDELRKLAAAKMAQEKPGQTLQATALVHEAYLRLAAGQNVNWANRRHFFGAAANAMRQIRVDDARKRKRLKRGKGVRPASVGDGPAVFDTDPAEVLGVNEGQAEESGHDGGIHRRRRCGRVR